MGRIDTSILLPGPIEEVFAFFADARNLETITPPWLHFSVITPEPIEMAVGTLLDYRLRIRGLPIGWRSRITAWEPPHRFVDEQVRGPYRRWVHEHTFEARNGGTEVRDRVDYRAPLAFLTERLLVRRDVERIFAYRQRKLEENFS
jgi:ligand-binding SRPBCC domain-containing protein